jgi:hypothetical protein
MGDDQDEKIAELEAQLRTEKRLRRNRRISESTKRALADPAVRAKMSEISKRALANPAVRAKMSEASKRAWADPAVRTKLNEASNGRRDPWLAALPDDFKTLYRKMLREHIPPEESRRQIDRLLAKGEKGCVTARRKPVPVAKSDPAILLM